MAPGRPKKATAARHRKPGTFGATTGGEAELWHVADTLTEATP